MVLIAMVVVVVVVTKDYEREQMMMANSCHEFKSSADGGDSSGGETGCGDDGNKQ